jgi:hypothetical protein
LTNAKPYAPSYFSCKPVLQVHYNQICNTKPLNDSSETELLSASETKALDDARSARSSALASRDAAAAAHALIDAELSSAEAALAGATIAYETQIAWM